MIVFLCVSAPRRSPSSIIERAARSLTEPPGLNHSAFAYTSTRGNSFSKIRTRRSGVLPISRVMPAGTTLCAILKRIESRSAGEVDQDDPKQDVHGSEAVADERPPVNAAS